jgi:hypothetical protein
MKIGIGGSGSIFSMSYTEMGVSGSYRVWGYYPTRSTMRCVTMRSSHTDPIEGRAGLDYQTDSARCIGD